MKKQYYISKEHNFKRRVVLFHDGEPVTIYDNWSDDVDNFIEDIEKQGYTKGYLPREVKAKWSEYEHIRKNIIYNDKKGIDNYA